MIHQKGEKVTHQGKVVLLVMTALYLPDIYTKQFWSGHLILGYSRGVVSIKKDKSMQELCQNDGDLEEVLKIKKSTTKTESNFKF